MSEVIIIDVLLPVVLMVILGWVVPQQLAKVMPEGVGPLFVLGGLAFIILWVFALLIFIALFLWREGTLDGVSILAITFVFGGSALRSALIWLPVMIISVANLPRHWVKETW